MPGGTLDLYPFAGARFPLHDGFIDLATTVLIFALFALGFNLLFGHTGELSFGHAMFFALGAYATALFTKGFDATWGLHLAFGGASNALGALCARARHRGALGVVRRAPDRAAFERHLLLDDHDGVRAGDLFDHVHWGDLTGGEDGIQGIDRPHLLPGLPADWLQDATHFFIFTAVIVFVAVALNYWILHSPFGSVLHAIRENKQRARFSATT
jgi:branched-chain amino acid transport system permease protein